MLQVAPASAIHAFRHPGGADGAAAAPVCVRDAVDACEQGRLDQQLAVEGLGQMRAGPCTGLPASSAPGTHPATTQDVCNGTRKLRCVSWHLSGCTPRFQVTVREAFNLSCLPCFWMCANGWGTPDVFQ